MSAGAAEATFSHNIKSVLSWSDALSGEQSGLYENGVRNEFSAVQETSETTCPVSTDLALVWFGLGSGLGQKRLGSGLGSGLGRGLGFAFDLRRESSPSSP